MDRVTIFSDSNQQSVHFYCCFPMWLNWVVSHLIGSSVYLFRLWMTYAWMISFWCVQKRLAWCRSYYHINYSTVPSVVSSTHWLWKYDFLFFYVSKFHFRLFWRYPFMQLLKFSLELGVATVDLECEDDANKFLIGLIISLVN